MSGFLMVEAEAVPPPARPVRAPHHDPDLFQDLMSRIHVKEQEEVNWKEVKAVLREKSKMMQEIERRKIQTYDKITKMKMEAKAAADKALENKRMVHGTWTKGESHLYWSSSDCSAIPHERSESLMNTGWGWDGGDGDGFGGTIGADAPPFHVGRPVTPIVWNSAKKTVPLVRGGWDGTGTGTSTPLGDGETSPTTKSGQATPTADSGGAATPTKQRTGTPERALKEPAVKPLEPFAGDPLQLNERMDFGLQKKIISGRIEQRKMSASTRRQKLNETMRGKGREMNVPFTTQQLCGAEVAAWSPMMKKKMGKILSPSAVAVYERPKARARPSTGSGGRRRGKGKGGTVTTGRKPLSRPVTSHGRLEVGDMIGASPVRPNSAFGGGGRGGADNEMGSMGTISATMPTVPYMGGKSEDFASVGAAVQFDL
jgi:hypothetical protein